MNLRRSAAKRYRSLTTVALLLSGSLLPLLPALAQTSPPPGTVIENQATATFTDAADNTTQNILSDKVSVTVAEVAGISVTGAAPSDVYRTKTVFFDFIVRNEGNDPTKLFVPAKPSAATIAGVALPAGSIGQLEVIEYSSDGSTITPITTGNLVDATAGSATSALGLPNDGSVPAGGFIKVRVPVTVPLSAVTGAEISITLGNTGGTDTNNTLLSPDGNDLFTEDNANNVGGETNITTPLNGVREASVTQTVNVAAPPNVTIQGTVFDDANGSAAGTFGTPTNPIQDGTEGGANVTPVIYAVLVDANNNVITSDLVGTDGTYTLTTPGVQNGLRVILKTAQPVIGESIPTGDLPPEWANTSPLESVAFDIQIANIIDKNFGVDKLPETQPVDTANQPNPPGTNKYKVPTLKAIDAEDDPTGASGTIKTFKIVTIPDATTQGILFYDGVAVIAGQTITNYDPLKLEFDPVDGPVSMSFTYAAIDAAGKEDPTPGTATMSFAATDIVISGTVYNDKNNSAAGTFGTPTNPIQDNGEVGTDSVFGTTTTPINAVLTTSAGVVLQTVPVNADGTYSFTVAASSTVRVILSRTPGTIGATLPRPLPPEGWVATSPLNSGVITTGFVPLTQNFGIRQKAKLVLLKRITKINGSTTNLNDNTSLTGVTAVDTVNGVGNWPANYIVGSTSAGLVKPGDTIEYTVYFLNNQGADATGVKICDPIKGSQDFLPGSIKLNLAGGSTDTDLTDADDSADRANSYLPGQIPSDCNAANSTAAGADNGGVAIGLTGTGKTTQADLTGIPGATDVATPAASYGLFRFSTTVGAGSSSAVSN